MGKHKVKVVVVSWWLSRGSGDGGVRVALAVASVGRCAEMEMVTGVMWCVAWWRWCGGCEGGDEVWSPEHGRSGARVWPEK
ncbi:hypothetical protein Tco_1426940 [Tanacetum coccineum]